jgi:hypothetical protein
MVFNTEKVFKNTQKLKNCKTLHFCAKSQKNYRIVWLHFLETQLQYKTHAGHGPFQGDDPQPPPADGPCC